MSAQKDSSELEDDETIADAEVYCCIKRDNTKSTPYIIISNQDPTILNIINEDGISTQQIKFTRVIHENLADELAATLGNNAIEWVWNGYNASIISYGCSGTGKTTLLLGSGNCNVNKLMIETESGKENFVVGFSCHEVFNNQIYDLVDAKPTQQYRTIRVNSFDELNTLLQISLLQSKSWTLNEKKEMSFLPNSSHIFIRIVLYSKTNNRACALQFVDMIGQQLDDSKKEQWSELVEREIAQFHKIIQMVSEMQNQDSIDSVEFSSEELKLGDMLIPLIAGNSKTFLLATVSNDPKYYEQSLNIFKTAERAMTISSLCKQMITDEDFPSLMEEMDINELEKKFITQKSESDIQNDKKEAPEQSKFNTLKNNEEVTPVKEKDVDKPPQKKETSSVKRTVRFGQNSEYKYINDNVPDIAAETSSMKHKTETETSREELLAQLSIERQIKEKMHQRIEDLKHELEEQKLKHEIEISDFKLQQSKLQEKLQSFVEASSHADLIKKYEADIARLEAQNDTLLKETIALNDRNYDLLLTKRSKDTKKPKSSNLKRKVEELELRLYDTCAQLRKSQLENNCIKRVLRNLRNEKSKFVIDKKKLDEQSKTIQEQGIHIKRLEEQNRKLERELIRQDSIVQKLTSIEKKLRVMLQTKNQQIEELHERVEELKDERKAETLVRLSLEKQQFVKLPGTRNTVEEIFQDLEKCIIKSSRASNNLKRLREEFENIEHELLDYATREKAYIELLMKYKSHLKQPLQ